MNTNKYEYIFSTSAHWKDVEIKVLMDIFRLNKLISK